MVKIKVLGAVINGCTEGAFVEVTEKEAAHYEKIGYAERVAEPVKAAPTKTKATTTNKKADQ